MPPILDRLVSQLQAKGKSKSVAFAIATKSLQRAGDLKKGSTQATSKGIIRGKMSPEQRSNDRAARRSGKHSVYEYSYDEMKNTSKLRKRK